MTLRKRGRKICTNTEREQHVTCYGQLFQTTFEDLLAMALISMACSRELFFLFIRGSLHFERGLKVVPRKSREGAEIGRLHVSSRF